MAVSRGERPARPNCKMHEELWMLINRCWVGDADARPSMQAIATDVSVPFTYMTVICKHIDTHFDGSWTHN